MKKNFYEMTLIPLDIYGWEVASSVTCVIEMPDFVDIEKDFERRKKVYERLGLEYCRIYGYKASFCEVRKIEKINEVIKNG